MNNKLFKALSDKTRRQILMMLKEEDLTAGKIAAEFDISKPSITHHLNILFEAELVSKERRGQYIYYSFNTTVMQEVLGWIMNFFDQDEDES